MDNANNTFKNNKLAYSDKTIDYPSSPNGKAYIGLAKEPLMANDNGIGFQGVLMQDEARERVQCYGCGEWFKIIGSKHILKCIGLTILEYKEKFGFNRLQGLVSDVTSLRYTQNVLKNKAGKEWFRKNRHILRGVALKKGPVKVTRQRQNSYGTCPAQLEDSLYRFILDNHELPTQRNRGRTVYKNIVNRHGRFGAALTFYGLPTMDRVGTNMRYTFKDHTVYRFNINKFYDRERLFNLMIDKCPRLKKFKKNVYNKNNQ